MGNMEQVFGYRLSGTGRFALIPITAHRSPNTDIPHVEELVPKKDRSDQEMQQVLEKGGRLLLVPRVADALEDPASDERRKSDPPVPDEPRNQIQHDRFGEHRQAERHRKG